MTRQSISDMPLGLMMATVASSGMFVAYAFATVLFLAGFVDPAIPEVIGLPADVVPLDNMELAKRTAGCLLLAAFAGSIAHAFLNGLARSRPLSLICLLLAAVTSPVTENEANGGGIEMVAFFGFFLWYFYWKKPIEKFYNNLERF